MTTQPQTQTAQTQSRPLHSQNSKPLFENAVALLRKREENHESNIEKAMLAMAEEKSENPDYTICPRDRFVSCQEQILLCKVYETSKIANFIRVFKLDDTVHATSISLFKRFYLTQAVFNHDIKVVLITCIFLAAKIESSYIPLTDFLAKVPQFQRPDVDVIRDYELIVADAVGFDFMVRQVKWPLHGLFLDLQTYFSTAYTSHDTRKQALNNLVKMYTRARELMQNALCSDLSLTHQSSQIALGCFVLASKELDATLATNKSDSQPKQQFLRDDLDRYISYRINWVGTDTIAALQQKLSSVEDAIMGQIEFEKMAKDTKSIVSVRAKEVGAKLQGCLNPEYLPNSRV